MHLGCAGVVGVGLFGDAHDISFPNYWRGLVLLYHAFDLNDLLSSASDRSRMWQLALGGFLSSLNLCPRTTLAESLLLALSCWVLGFICGSLVTVLIVSQRCRQLVGLLLRELVRPLPIQSPEDRLAGYRRSRDQ